MTTHDPRKVIEDLRNHLAAHDRGICFLFGAGTSCSINIAPAPAAGERPSHLPLIPGIEGLTEICGTAVSNIGVLQDQAWKAMVEQCEHDGKPANVENVLSKVRMKIDAIGEGETLVGLTRAQLSEIEIAICSAISKTVSPSEDKIPQQLPHSDFALWVKKVNRTAPLELFTTNYDVLFERAFEAARVPVFDGFVGTCNAFFYPECLDEDDLLPKPKWVRLWKLHGSVNWHRETEIAGKRIVRMQPSESGEMILPSHWKYDESRKQPYMAYMDRLSRLLNCEHALLITCGYSFGDEHINAILYGALDNRSTSNVIALQFQDLNEEDDIVRVAIRRSNLSVIAPNGGVVSGTWGIWQLTQPVDNRTCPFMDVGFDSNAVEGDGSSLGTPSADLMGRMRLGNFYWFCRFLNAMGSEIQ